MGGPPASGLGEVLTTPQRENISCYETESGASDLARRMRWVGYVERMGQRRGVYRVLVRKPEGKETAWETQA